MTEKSTFYGVIVLLLAALAISSSVCMYYYTDYMHELSLNNSNTSEVNYLLSKYNATIDSRILLDFGNGTSHWYNNTQIQPSWNLYLGTLVITSGNVNATWYGPPLSEHYVTGIDGVQDTNSEFWFFWIYNGTSSSWEIPQLGADRYMMYNGSIYAWTFCGMNSTTYEPTCTPA